MGKHREKHRHGSGRSTARPRAVHDQRTQSTYRDQERRAARRPAYYSENDNVRDTRVHNYPPRWNGAPSQHLLVIRRNHKTGEVSLELLDLREMIDGGPRDIQEAMAALRGGLRNKQQGASKNLMSVPIYLGISASILRYLLR